MLLRTAAVALLLTLGAHGALAQSTLLQGGPWTPNHIPIYSNGGGAQTTVIDGGDAGGGSSGVGVSEFGMQIQAAGSPPFADAGSGPNAENFCNYDGPTDSPDGYHYLCMSPNADGGALISTGALGGASEQPLYFLINGVKTQFSVGTGTVTSVATGTGLTGGTITSTGTISIANTIAAGGPVGDAGHVAQITYNAQGQLTAVTSVPIVASATSVAVGVTTVTGGTSGRVLYDSAGVLGELAVTGTGNAVLATSPSVATANLTSPTITTSIAPTTDDGAPLGSTTKKFSDLFLASGGVVNWASNDVTITHSPNVLSFEGASTGYLFDAPIRPVIDGGNAVGASGIGFSGLFLSSGATINFNAGNWIGTHTSGVLTVNPGDIRVSTAGTNAASVVTTAGTQTLTNKTYDTAGAGNSFAINGVAVTANTGTGAVARAVSPTFTTPTLGAALATSINFGGTSLSNYTEGTWTPSVTFATPGDLSVVYSAQTGIYTRVGRMVVAQFTVVTSTFTYTTASGNLTLNGLPVTVISTGAGACSLQWAGITKASYTSIAPQPSGSSTSVLFLASGSGQAASAVTTSDVPSAGTVRLIGTCTYFS